MNLNLIAIEIVMLVICLMSVGIAYEFYRSKNGMLRKLLIALFVCKIWVYGGAGIFFLIWPPNATALIRILILNLPMCIVMLYLWKYIRFHNRF